MFVSPRSYSSSSSTSTTSSSPVWDPWKAFSIVNPNRGFRTCVGYAETRKRRCENHICMSWAGANEILHRLSMERPSVSRMIGDVEELAICMLCPRWHQNEWQINKMVEKWCLIIREEKRKLRNQDLETLAQMLSSGTTGRRERSDSMFSSSPSPPDVSRQSQNNSTSSISTPRFGGTSTALTFGASTTHTPTFTFGANSPSPTASVPTLVEELHSTGNTPTTATASPSSIPAQGSTVLPTAPLTAGRDCFAQWMRQLQGVRVTCVIW